MGYSLTAPTFYPLFAATGNNIMWSTATSIGQAGFITACKGDPAQNDYCGFGFYVGSSCHVQLQLALVTSTDTGIITFYLDGVNSTTPATYDTYAAAAAADSTTIDLGVVSAGYHNIQMRMATKNAASTAYNLDLCSVTVVAI